MYKTVDDPTAPWNFSWIVAGELAGMACPDTKQNIEFLVRSGIRHLVTLSPETKPPTDSLSGIEWTLIPVEEFEAPALEDILKFINICNNCKEKGEVRITHGNN